MPRPKRLAAMGQSSAESSPEKGSPNRKRVRREKRPESPILEQPKAPPRRGRPPKSPSKAKPQPKARKAVEEPEKKDTSALVRAFKESSKTTASVSETDIISAKTPTEVASLLNSLVSTEQDALFTAFREKTAEKTAKDSQIIADLSSQLDAKQTTIDTLAQQIHELQNSLADAEDSLQNSETHTPQKKRAGKEMYESPIRRKPTDSLVHRSNLDDEFKTIAFTFDMLELLTGVRIISYKVDRDKFLFDVKQTSTVTEQENDIVSIEYQLMIQRDFEEKAEVTYIPVFLEGLSKRARDAEQEAKNKDAAKVRVHLPTYLQQHLNFPYNTLSQFYTKLSKALNKSTKS